MIRVKLDKAALFYIHSPQPLSTLSRKKYFSGHVQVTYVQGLKKTEKKDKHRLFIDEVIVVKTSRWLWPAVSETVNWQTGRNNESCHNGTR